MTDIDQLGSFYLGRPHDLKTGKTDAQPLLYDSDDLTTHAVCVGMTGSGKTGLCLSLLEEAALDGIPAIAIDPKGDLSNLLLAFPNLAPSDFRPWIDESEAARKQMSPDDFAKQQAELWRSGLEKWDEGPDRIRRYLDKVERVIYTPGSSAGIPITVLKSFNAPPKELVDDADAFGERISSATSGLLALMGIDADPVRSREHIFLSNVFDHSWRAAKDLDLRQLIQSIHKPPFKKIGVVDMDSFFPAKEREKLALQLNNLLASPSFAAWMEGEPLDVGRLLHAPGGKPRLAIMSISHLDDAQRMFFVTILLNEVLAWIRTQPGTTSLRALLYMDEVFGYFPPLGNPPAKRPMLTLLKQARAFGLGCVLATQNPVDLDYKGLSNAGTWFLGRLQTERDKARVIEGLEGASAQAGATFNRQQMEATLAGLGNRIFLMNNVHQDKPVVFQTRWAMSYLRGPLTRAQIKTLMDPIRSEFTSAAADKEEEDGGTETSISDSTVAKPTKTAKPVAANRPILPATIREQFVTINERVPDGYQLEYRPGLLGKGKVHFVRKTDGIDVWRDCFVLQSIHDTPPDDVWEGSFVYPQDPVTESDPDPTGRFAELPSEMTRDKSYPLFARHLREHLFRDESLKVWKCTALDQCSHPDEEEADFRARLGPLLEERLKVERIKLEKAYATKRNDAETKLSRAQARYSTQKWQFFARLGSIAWVVADTVLSAMGKGLPGRRRSIDPALRGVATERGQQSNAQISVDSAQKEMDTLEQEFNDKLKSLGANFSTENVQVESFELKPQKGDIEVDKVSLVWLPWRIDKTGHAEPVY